MRIAETTGIPEPQASMEAKDPEPRDRFTIGDFACFRAREGGWIVYHAFDAQAMNPPVVALSTKQALVEWLADNLVEDN